MDIAAASRPRILNTEELLRRIEAEKETRQTKAKNSNALRTYLCVGISFVVIALALGGTVFMLKSEIVAVKSELSELKSFKSQMTTIDPKLKLALIETKLEDYKINTEKLKAEFSGQVEGIKEDFENFRTTIKKPRR